jgi:alcohol dehydrogenase class IV
MLSFEYLQPTRIIFGSGEIARLGALCKPTKANVLLVVDKILEEQGLASAAKESLDAADISWRLFTDVLPNPTSQSVDLAVGSLKDNQIGAVIGMGGGSAIDYAKALAVGLSHQGGVWDYVNEPNRPVKAITDATLPIIAIPTTAGTGAEATPMAVLVNADTQVKRALFSENIYPRQALVDPALTLTVPPGLTLSTGIDALSHAIEALISVEGRAYTAMLALEAIRRIGRNLTVAVADGSNLDARENLSYAATLAGLAIGNGEVTLPHALAHPLGGRFNIPHGEAIAMVLPEMMRASWMCNPARFAAIARALESATPWEGDYQAARKSVSAINSLYSDCGFSRRLSDYGVSEKDLEAIAKDAAGYMAGCLSMHPRKMEPASLAEMLGKML